MVVAPPRRLQRGLGPAAHGAAERRRPRPPAPARPPSRAAPGRAAGAERRGAPTGGGAARGGRDGVCEEPLGSCDLPESERKNVKPPGFSSENCFFSTAFPCSQRGRTDHKMLYHKREAGCVLPTNSNHRVQ